MTSGKMTVPYSARAPCRGTVCHTHSMRSGTTLTSSYLLYQAMTAEQQLCAAFGWRQHTLSEIRDNSDKVYNTLSLTGHDIRDSDSVLLGATLGRGTLHGDSLPHTLTGIRDNSDKVYIIPGRNRDPALYSAGAPCRGTTCNTHSLRSGSTQTRLIYQAMTSRTVTLCCTQLAATYTH